MNLLLSSPRTKNYKWIFSIIFSSNTQSHQVSNRLKDNKSSQKHPVLTCSHSFLATNLCNNTKWSNRPMLLKEVLTKLKWVNKSPAGKDVPVQTQNAKRHIVNAIEWGMFVSKGYVDVGNAKILKWRAFTNNCRGNGIRKCPNRLRDAIAKRANVSKNTASVIAMERNAEHYVSVFNAAIMTRRKIISTSAWARRERWPPTVKAMDSNGGNDLSSTIIVINQIITLIFIIKIIKAPIHPKTQ